jgi:hypothetical protein
LNLKCGFLVSKFAFTLNSRRYGEERGWTCEIPVKDVAIMRKPL